jgi:hypothetical protein
MAADIDDLSPPRVLVRMGAEADQQRTRGDSAGDMASGDVHGGLRCIKLNEGNTFQL